MFEHDYKAFPELTNAQLETLRFTSPHEQITEDFVAEVVKVHDGDTITLRTKFRDFDFPLRLLGIDAPELSEGGEETQKWLESRLLNQKIEIRIDPSNRVGKYGRLLGYVYLNGLDIGNEMLNLGLVSEFGKKRENEVQDINRIMKEGEIA